MEATVAETAIAPAQPIAIDEHVGELPPRCLLDPTLLLHRRRNPAESLLNAEGRARQRRRSLGIRHSQGRGPIDRQGGQQQQAKQVGTVRNRHGS